MRVLSTEIDGLIVLEIDVYRDERGFFCEIYHRARYARCGVNDVFVQDNLSWSRQGVLRGLHFQVRQPQAKLVQVLTGTIFDVAVDLRHGSPTFGRWAAVELSGENRRQVYIPEGCAHGFCVLSEGAHVNYKCSSLYAPGDEGGIIWSDPDLAIPWPLNQPLLSAKDSRHPRLRDLEPDELPRAAFTATGTRDAKEN